MMAEAHYRLRQETREDLEFRDCYMYGTSPANQRIEAWWAQLTRAYLFRWIIYFKDLMATNLYRNDVKEDCITLYAIYLPIIRQQILDFVTNWNNHTIRKQKNRPNVQAGKPYMLFMHPNNHTQNYGTPVPREKLAELRRDVQE
ncbi:MAG: hypothetical protein Q9182_007132 [Xanthomendoza sp. 2 TL-2023]